MNKIFFLLASIIGLSSFPLGLYGQYNLSNTLKEKFDTYRNDYFQEKVYVHTDRSFYVTGDYVWMKVLAVEGTTHTPSALSKVVYVEIVDANNTAIVQAKISLEKGRGNTALYLPASLNSGNYTVRAYTRWMKNFSPELYFSKNISIVNTFKPLETRDSSASKINNDIDLQFFPEGGDLVEGLKSKVAFRMVDKNGESLAREGYICNASNDTLAAFETLKLGIGSFYFTPTQGESYHAIVRDLSGGFIEKTFPKAKAEGYVMESLVEEGKIKIRIKSKGISRDDLVYLFVHTRNKSHEVKSQSLANGETTFTIDMQGLDDGISHMTVFDSRLMPVCERLYFKQPVNTLHIETKLNAKKYFPRRKMIVEIDTKDLNGNARADLSISAYRLDTLPAKDPLNIQDYILLTSDLVGAIESPGYYFSDDKDVVAATDNLMLTHGWRRFNWKQVLDSEPLKLDFIPEFRGHIIEGTVHHLTSAEVGVNIATYLSVAGKQFLLRGSKSNREGKVYFEMGNFFGDRQLIVQTNTQVDSMYAVTLDHSFSDKYSSIKTPEFNLTSRFRSELLKRSVNMQMANAYYDNVQASRVLFRSDSVPFFGSSDAHYRLDSYTRFPVMEEVMREYVPSVFVRKRKGDFHFLVVNKLNSEVLRKDPLILLDGVPIFDTNKVMALDPLLVENLDVVARRYYYGPLTFDGIVSYTTYGKESFDFPISSNALITDYKGMEFQREFFSPVYETKEQKNNRIPDFRDLLYWSPSVHTDENGKALISFYTSDQTGSYMLNIQGLTDDGNVGSMSYQFSVDEDVNN